jgi:hypothetical protein
MCLLLAGILGNRYCCRVGTNGATSLYEKRDTGGVTCSGRWNCLQLVCNVKLGKDLKKLCRDEHP